MSKPLFDIKDPEELKAALAKNVPFSQFVKSYEIPLDDETITVIRTRDKYEQRDYLVLPTKSKESAYIIYFFCSDAVTEAYSVKTIMCLTELLYSNESNTSSYYLDGAIHRLNPIDAKVCNLTGLTLSTNSYRGSMEDWTFLSGNIYCKMIPLEAYRHRIDSLDMSFLISTRDFFLCTPKPTFYKLPKKAKK